MQREVRKCRLLVLRGWQCVQLCLYVRASRLSYHRHVIVSKVSLLDSYLTTFCLMVQACRDLILTLASLSPSQQLVLLHLVGDDGSLEGLGGGIALLMAPYMKTPHVYDSGDEIMRLEVPWHAFVIKVWHLSQSALWSMGRQSACHAAGWYWPSATAS